ncbi:replication protein [Methylobacterium sp. 4-46]|uniref:replication initiator protein A n=1 Tax=unclassified Methylobacterium TaxID=2615210 RepID=UPI000152DCC3|nr:MULTISPECIES: replication initiator protein A [unclassified Methylobacterium]ACA17854.1 replication protein [Methylobacterium sp. 4-46]
MARVRLHLKSREDFAALSLHEKNAYLQDVAERVMKVRGEEHVPLSKDALSRLRRFYMRRSFADLKREEIEDEGMRHALDRMAEAIRADEVQKVIEHELPSPRKTAGPEARRITRPPPDTDAQLMFWVPAVFDAPIKDDMNLMDVAPFALSKTAGEGIIRYELKDAIITIEGGAEVGLATAYDYDIVINMISHLAEAVRVYRIEEAKGRRPSLPGRVYRPAAAEILKFCRRDLGGKQYIDLERALDRLQATRVKITNLHGGKRRETQSFPLIGRYKVVSRTVQDRIDQIEIEIPNWVYEGIVKPDGKPTILTLNADYFLINRPIAKFIYRLARKAAGETEARYSLPELHKRSGSKLPPHKFRQAVEDIVQDAQLSPLPDYDLILEKSERSTVLRMRRRAARREGAESSGRESPARESPAREAAPARD